ncbi:hypothetical protein K7432_002554 [Basidiobolus ranarum]|uniref:Uncharacterized protein n=1 Tax=Basidiobolus ranarum TaxID=34480 RepID=A0ABR2W7V8_9FUNG
MYDNRGTLDEQESQSFFLEVEDSVDSSHLHTTRRRKNTGRRNVPWHLKINCCALSKVILCTVILSWIGFIIWQLFEIENEKMKGLSN